jgi:Peptidase C10 family/Spi protease inhibitor
MRNSLTLFVILLFLSLSFTLFAKPISVGEAEEVAKVAFKTFSSNLNSTQAAKVVSKYTKTQDGQETYHIFNFAPRGFVIIAADDSYNAVLAFSDESTIDFNDKTSEKSGVLFGTLSVSETRIAYMRQKGIEAPTAIRTEWESLRRPETRLQTREILGIIVAPLTTTKWNQGKYYNAECPANATTATTGPDGRTYCGCAPIAMSQLIKFHNHPQIGNGSKTYQDPTFGTLSADFCSTKYNWANMPNELTSPNADVAKLIYHVGVSTNTYYSTTYTSTFVSNVRDALVNYFKFDNSAKFFYDAQYDKFAGVAKKDLDAGRPLLLTGTSRSGGAHAWVADGYGNFSLTTSNAAAEYFHFNWGWGGDNNGWFLDSGSSWNPLPNQPGGLSSISYYYDRFVVHNVFPATSACQAPSIDDIYPTGNTDSYVYVNVSSGGSAQDIAFRYRKQGTTAWTTTTPTQNYYQILQNLSPATIYEFQAQRKCCPEIWSDFSATDTFRTVGTAASTCVAEAANKLTTSSITETGGYVYSSLPYGSDKTKQFRYRKIGTTDWTTNATTTLHYNLLSGLTAGTAYEFQVRHECSAGVFSEYSQSSNFTTSGGTPPPINTCTVEPATTLTTSSITETSGYIYSAEPNGRGKNKQFRYRKTGTTDWTTNALTTSYYNYLTNLSAGTNYEFQVRHECSAGVFSDYSASASFKTQGNVVVNPTDPPSTTCAAEAVSGLTTSSVTASYCYVYTSQPRGRDKINQFRYRPMGGGTWVETNATTNYYRFLSDLRASTQYEFQVKHDCGGGNWSSYSASAFFTTMGSN